MIVTPVGRFISCSNLHLNVVVKIVAQLLIFPLGRAWARLFPRLEIFGLSLNPGPFSIKEHVRSATFRGVALLTSCQVLATIMASVGSGSAYATDIVAVQRVYYNQNYNFGCEPQCLIAFAVAH